MFRINILREFCEEKESFPVLTLLWGSHCNLYYDYTQNIKLLYFLVVKQLQRISSIKYVYVCTSIYIYIHIHIIYPSRTYIYMYNIIHIHIHTHTYRYIDTNKNLTFNLSLLTRCLTVHLKFKKKRT